MSVLPFSIKAKKEESKDSGCRGCKREFKSLLDKLQEKALQMKCQSCEDEEDKKDFLRRVMSIILK